MATYEKIDDDTVEVTTIDTVTKKKLEQELLRLNQNIAHKEALRDETQTQLDLLRSPEDG